MKTVVPSAKKTARRKGIMEVIYEGREESGTEDRTLKNEHQIHE